MSEPLDDVDDKDDNRTDFVNAGSNLVGSVNYKLAFFVFVMGMIIFSDLFIETILANIQDTVDGECATTKGTIIQLVLLCIGMIVVDLLIQYETL